MRVNGFLQTLRRVAAIAILSAVYRAALLVARSRYRCGQRSSRRSRRILLIGTFHNPNWAHSHLRPLVRSGMGKVILVCDEIVAQVSGVRFERPPRWMAAGLGRAGAKFLWALRCAFRYRPDLYVGYHIFPCAVMALFLARLFGRPACYQDTSGPLELEGGGWHAENSLLKALQGPSALIERLALQVVREFDSVVVRGRGAQAYIRESGYRGNVAVITGSVEPTGAWRDFHERSIDLAFVGRLTEYKRPDRFLAIVAAMTRANPGIRAVVVGGGPDADTLKAMALRLNIDANVTFLGQRSDVDDLLAITRVFFLTSRWEGVSIAMLEAMAAGAVPVVAEVGDLADLVQNEVTGFILPQDDIAGFAREASRLLSSRDLWRGCSKRAVDSALAHSGTETIARRWQEHLRAVVAGPAHRERITYAERRQ